MVWVKGPWCTLRAFPFVVSFASNHPQEVSMRIRMKVAAVELQSDDAALVKLYPVNEQPEPLLFPKDVAPQATFALQVAPGMIANFRIGKEFDILFALPIHELPAEGSLLPAGAKPGEAVPVTHKQLIKMAKNSSRLESLHGHACNLRTGEGPECTCAHSGSSVTAAPDYDVSAETPG